VFEFFRKDEIVSRARSRAFEESLRGEEIIVMYHASHTIGLGIRSIHSAPHRAVFGQPLSEISKRQESVTERFQFPRRPAMFETHAMREFNGRMSR